MAEPQWRDSQGDIWTTGPDGLLHTPETAPFSREHVEKKWGPLIPIPQGPDVSILKPTRLLEFLAKVESMGLSLVKANDPEDGVLSWYMDWHDVSKIIQHYEKIIDGLKEDLDNVPYTY